MSLPTDLNATRQVLQGLYQRTLEVAKQMPGDAAYRQQLEVVTNSRLETLQAVCCL
jgi:hypothetical protein